MDLEFAARAICRAGGLCKYTGPKCNTGRCVVSSEAAAAGLRAVLALPPTKPMIGAGFMAIPEWDTLDHVIACAKIWSAMSAALVDQMSPEQRTETSTKEAE